MVDLRELVLFLGLMSLLQSIALAIQSKHSPNVQGPSWWALGFLLQALGFWAALVRDYPDLRVASIVLSNFGLLGSQFCFYAGICRHLDRRACWRLLAAIAVPAAAAMLFFTFLKDALDMRVSCFSLAMVAAAFLSIKELAAKRSADRSASLRFLSLLIGAEALVHSIRIFYPILTKSEFRLFDSNQLFYTAYFLILAAYTFKAFVFVLIVNEALQRMQAESRRHLQLVLDTMPNSLVLSTFAEGRLVEANSRFEEFYGVPKAGFIGRTSLDLSLWPDEESRRKAVETLEEKGRLDDYEMAVRKADGSTVECSVSAARIDLGGVPHLVSVLVDISERKAQEEKVRSLLKEKELVLAEVHHRIKNNMAVVSGLLELHSAEASNPEVKAALDDATRRVSTMMLLYDKLYRADEYTVMVASKYLPDLVDQILSHYPMAERLTVAKEIGDFEIEPKRLSLLGIILNELLSNALKHAFRGRESGRLTVRAIADTDGAVLEVEDDGVGLRRKPAHDGADDFGFMLVEGLAAQLGGSFALEGASTGTLARVSFPL